MCNIDFLSRQQWLRERALTLRYTYIVCLASMVLTADVTEDTKTHNSDLVIVPICTVFMAVKALGKYCGRVFEWD
jgi:hypothetical protein